MKIAIIRNTPNAKVLFRRGRQNREFYRESDIAGTRDALVACGHEVEVLEGDATLVETLRQTYALGNGDMPDDLFAFNLAYGIQGDCRYAHIPSMLEMLGVPYLGSGPSAHAVALDKYLAKILMERAGLPTPPCQLMQSPDDKLAESMTFPLVVKPQFESTSFGLRVVQSRDELAEAVANIIAQFAQPALAEAFVDGREVNCGILGNAPPVALPVLEIDFGAVKGLDRVLTLDAKKHRQIEHRCPADLSAEQTDAIQRLTVSAFRAVGCCDCARADFRIDQTGKPWILEVNSMAAIHSDGSYYYAARALGWSYPTMIRKILEVALARYANSEGA